MTGPRIAWDLDRKRVKKVGGATLGRPALMWTNRRAPLGEGVTHT